ncbi:MAG: polymerase subunit sigma [Planctomycetaceae bacterium]|nr:polymerase subunit sigma [Planctomycetaceae bacterium]
MSDTEQDIQPLLDRLGRGETEVMGELFVHFQERLWRMVDLRLDRRLGGRVSASDVVQETYIDAQKRVQHFLAKPDMPFFVWLRLVASQRLIDVHRQHLGAQMRDAGQEVSLVGAGQFAATSICLVARLAGDDTSPSRAAIRGEVAEQIEAILNSMEPIDREVLALRHFEELSNQEVAEILGIDKGAASKRYIRALDRLKDVLEKLPGIYGE